MRRNDCLDLIKCIACIGIVFIHVTFPGQFGQNLAVMFHWAVPFFIMVSGYYAFGCDETVVKRRLLKILRILLFGTVLFFLISVIYPIKDNRLMFWLAENFNQRTLPYLFVFCTIRWAIQLWYLIAMAETYLLWLLAVKRGWQDAMVKMTWPLFLIGFIWGLWIQSLNLDEQRIWSYQKIFLLSALPWFLLGYLMRERYSAFWKRIGNKQLLAAAFTGFMLLILFRSVVGAAYFGRIVVASSIFMLGLKNPEIKFGKTAAYVGNKLSLYVYIYHTCIAGICSMFFSFIGINTDGAYLYVQPLITVLLTVLAAMGTQRLVSRQKTA